MDEVDFNTFTQGKQADASSIGLTFQFIQLLSSNSFHLFYFLTTSTRKRPVNMPESEINQDGFIQF
jgi:hypothetical protein